MTSNVRIHRSLSFAGVATIISVIVMVAAWIAEAGAVAGVAGLIAFATGATVAGADSRSGGDWVSTSRV
jgi:hypothetical protein